MLQFTGQRCAGLRPDVCLSHMMIVTAVCHVRPLCNILIVLSQGEHQASLARLESTIHREFTGRKSQPRVNGMDGQLGMVK